MVYTSGNLNHFYAYIYDDIVVIVKTNNTHKIDIKKNAIFKSIVLKKTNILL